MTKHSAQSRPEAHFGRPPIAVQILAIIGYTGFAIPVSIIAMDQFGFLGIALTAFLAWQWTRIAAFGGHRSIGQTVEDLKPQVDVQMSTTSGNASFDRYRDELMDRLREEQTQFECFLERLRTAKDKSEFDQFMDDRARVIRSTATPVQA